MEAAQAGNITSYAIAGFSIDNNSVDSSEINKPEVLRVGHAVWLWNQYKRFGKSKADKKDNVLRVARFFIGDQCADWLDQKVQYELEKAYGQYYDSNGNQKLRGDQRGALLSQQWLCILPPEEPRPTRLSSALQQQQQQNDAQQQLIDELQQQIQQKDLEIQGLKHEIADLKAQTPSPQRSQASDASYVPPSLMDVDKDDHDSDEDDDGDEDGGDESDNSDELEQPQQQLLFFQRQSPEKQQPHPVLDPLQQQQQIPVEEQQRLSPTQQQKPLRLSNVTSTKCLNLRDRTKKRGMQPFSLKYRRAVMQLSVMHRMSAAQVVASTKVFAEIFGYVVNPPAIRTVGNWREGVVFLNNYQITDLIQLAASTDDFICVAADATTKRTSKSQKASFVAYELHSASGTVVITPSTVSDGKGLTMAIVLRQVLLSSAREFFTAQALVDENFAVHIEADETTDVATERTIEIKATEMAEQLVGKTNAFLGDRGSTNETFVRAMAAWKSTLVAAENIDVTETDKLAEIMEVYNEMCKKAVDNGSFEMIRLNCTLHIVSTLNGCFMKAADQVFAEIAKVVYADEDLPSNYFSHTLSLLYTYLEPRNDSGTSLATHFHAAIAAKTKLTKENTLWKSLGHREYAGVHNCAAFFYSWDTAFELLSSVEFSATTEKISVFIRFLQRPEVYSAIRIGAVLHHYLLMPLLSQSTLSKGAEALNVQQEFRLFLKKLLAIEQPAVSDVADEQFLRAVGYEMHPNKRTVAEHAINAEWNQPCDKLFISAAVAAFHKKFKEAQPVVVKYFDSLGKEEQEAVAKKIAHAPFSNWSPECTFSTTDAELKRAPNQLVAVTTAIVAARRNKLFEYLEKHKDVDKLMELAAKRSKDLIRRYESDAKQHHEQALSVMRRRHDEIKQKNIVAWANTVEEQTTEIEKCGGAWINDKARVAAVSKLRCGPHFTKTQLAQHKLVLHRIQVRFWRKIILEPNRITVSITKAVNDMLMQECVEFLKEVWNRFPAKEADNEVAGQEIEMEFKDETGAVVDYRGHIVSRVPGDKTRTWFFVRFTEPDDDGCNYVYNLRQEIEKKNVKNVDQVALLWNNLGSSRQRRQQEQQQEQEEQEEQ